MEHASDISSVPGAFLSNFNKLLVPVTARSGQELSACGRLKRVAVRAEGDELELSEPVLVHDGLSTTMTWPNRPFDVTPDGQRVLFIRDDAPVAEPELRLVTHLLEEVRAKREERN